MQSQQTTVRAVHLVALDRGEDVVSGVLEHCRERGIAAAAVTGIGAVAGVEIGAFDPERRAYDRVRPDGVWELLSLTGNVAVDHRGELVFHAHVTLGDAAGRVRGGHLFAAGCAVTVELVMTEVDGDLRRAPDEATGLVLWRL